MKLVSSSMCKLTFVSPSHIHIPIPLSAMILKPGQKIAMKYVSFDVDIVGKYHIKIINWPADVPFIKPADIGNIDHLRKLVTAFKTGTTYWRPLTKGEKKQVDDEAKARKDAGVVAKKPRAKRSDAGLKRGPHINHKRKTNGTTDKENGSARKRARAENYGEGTSTGAFKSREFVESDEDDLENDDNDGEDDGEE